MPYIARVYVRIDVRTSYLWYGTHSWLPRVFLTLSKGGSALPNVLWLPPHSDPVFFSEPWLSCLVQDCEGNAMLKVRLHPR